MAETTIWRTPEALVALGFERGRLVLMNEAHNGLPHCVRTRVVGRRVLPAAHAAGARHLALEAIYPPFAEACNRTRAVPADGMGYLGQPDMRALLLAALDLGWTLWPYEAEDWRWLAGKHGYTGPVDMATRAAHRAELLSPEYTNWREEQQARNVAAILAGLPAGEKLLVWCGNGHLTKTVIQDWAPMGYHLVRLGAAPFAIDQIRTVNFGDQYDEARAALVARYRAQLEVRGGTAGFLATEAPPELRMFASDAYVLSVENALE